MKLARSSFYYRPRDKDARNKADADLRDRIEAICLGFPRYGYRRVTAALKRQNLCVNHKKVLRLMRESDLLCRVKRRRVKTTDSRHHFPRYPNLIKGMVITRLNQVWLSDITYIRISTGFIYLAAILDAFSRKAIGYAVSTTLDTALTLQASRWRQRGGSQPRVLSTTRTKGYSMPQKNMWMSSRNTGFSSAWRGWAILTKMP